MQSLAGTNCFLACAQVLHSYMRLRRGRSCVKVSVQSRRSDALALKTSRVSLQAVQMEQLSVASSALGEAGAARARSLTLL